MIFLKKKRASLIAYNIDLIIAFTNTYDENICFREIFQTTNSLLKMLPTQNYPKALNVINKSETNFTKF